MFLAFTFFGSMPLLGFLAATYIYTGAGQQHFLMSVVASTSGAHAHASVHAHATADGMLVPMLMLALMIRGVASANLGTGSITIDSVPIRPPCG